MTSCFVRPTPQTLWQQITSWFSAQVLGGAPIIPESNEYYLCGNDLAAAELYYSLSEQQWEQTQDATACCDNLIAINAPLGFIPFGKTFTQGYVTITGGPPNDPIPAALQFQIGSNTLFPSTATNANPTNLDANGNATLLLTAQIPGADVNTSINTAITQINGQVSNVSATIINAPVGWPTNVTPNGAFCGGNDAETCEQFRARVIARKQIQPNATYAKAIEFALQYPCVTRVMQRTCGTCCVNGVMQLYVFMDSAFANGIAPASALAGLTTYLFGSPQGNGLGKMPVGIFGAVYPIAPVTLNVMFYNFGCITPSQFTLIQQLMGELFATLTPGQSICADWIKAIVVSVNPNCCNYQIVVTNPGDPSLGTVDCFGDFTPACDVLPVLGTVNYSAQLQQSL